MTTETNAHTSVDSGSLDQHAGTRAIALSFFSVPFTEPFVSGQN